MIKGLVIGKFYPPHKGHQFLVESAFSSVDHLTIIVCDSSEESIPGKLRAKWLQQIHPEADVKIINYKKSELADDDSKGWAKATVKLLGYIPDLVFTSEDYGDNYAKFLGSKHILVDRARKKVPISGTKIRNNPDAYLDYLEPVVRSFFIKRVCVVGAESSGTTTLAKALASYYKTCWVPEYGRSYWEGKLNTLNASNWKTEEFVHIASMQNQIEDELANSANKILICDTNSWATSVWHKRYIGKSSTKVEMLSKHRKYDLYLITDIDIPFTQDGTRDGEKIREWMHNYFIKLLSKKGERYLLISGNRKKRLQTAVSAINRLLEKPLT